MKLACVLLMFSGCAHRQAPVHTPVHRGNYAYVETTNGKYFILTSSDAIPKEALTDIGCGPCAIQYEGRAWSVEKPR